MGTSLLFRMTKAFQSNPGTCKDIFRINLKMGKSSEQNPTICCRQPENTNSSGNSSARRPKRKSMNSAGSENGSLTRRACTSQVKPQSSAFDQRGHAHQEIVRHARALKGAKAEVKLYDVVHKKYSSNHQSPRVRLSVVH
jgi:hypothetical protein